MDPLSRINIFLEVVKAASFAGAGRKLGITSSAVSKQIQNLEHDLQIKLLNRTTRNVSVTEEGALYFDRAGRALEDLQEAEEQIHELKSRPRGSLKVSIPSKIGVTYLAKAITDFAKLYPQVNLDLNFEDTVVDIIDEGFDLAIRIGVLEDSSLISRRLASCPIYVCASPEYLKKHGTPTHPDDLLDHNVLAYTRNKVTTEWAYQDASGKQGEIRLHGNFRCDTGDMQRQAVLDGVGIAILPLFYVNENLANGDIVRILEDYTTWPDRNIYAVFRPNKYLSTRLRLFVDHMTIACKQLPWEQ